MPKLVHVYFKYSIKFFDTWEMREREHNYDKYAIIIT